MTVMTRILLRDRVKIKIRIRVRARVGLCLTLAFIIGDIHVTNVIPSDFFFFFFLILSFLSPDAHGDDHLPCQSRQLVGCPGCRGSMYSGPHGPLYGDDRHCKRPRLACVSISSTSK